jgi:hypothetical protein
MNKRNLILLNNLDEFKNILKSHPQDKTYVENVIDWVESTLRKADSNEERTAFVNNIIKISEDFLSETKGIISIGVINAQKVIQHLKKTKPNSLKLKQGYDASQVITLFRILHKELQIFDNSNEEVIRALDNLIECSKGNIKDYFIRKKNRANEKKVKKLFKCEWADIY